MFVTVVFRRLAALAAHVLKALELESGNQLELREDPDGYVLQSRRIDPSRLAPLRGKLRRGRGTFDMASVREQVHEPSLRD